MNFNSLVLRIQETNDYLQQKAVKAVNTHITLINWLTGFYIGEFEQNGSDRAEYGVRLLEKITKNITIRGLSEPELSRCRQFYATYPQFLGLLTQELQNEENKYYSTIFQNISYTHFTELIKIDAATKRRFYELFVLKTQPTVKK